MKAAQLSRVICNLCSPLGIAEIRRQIPIISGRSHKISPMASGEHDNTRIHTFYTKRLSGSSSRTDDSQTRQDASDHDYYISSNENQCRRPSTAEDEQRVKNLLKEIIAYRENKVSSWIVESKVKNLCAAYKYLLKSHRDGFLKVLACDHAVDHQMVCKAAESLLSIEQKPDDECNRRQIMKGEEQLKSLLTPQYAWLFVHVGRLERGVKFLVDLRTDVLAVISELDVKDPAMVPMQKLNLTLREMLSLWFSVGFLNLERITWRSPCEMLQKISEYEAVHPMRNWTDLKRRVGPYRRCFVYTHSSMPDEPLVVLHTALSDEIARSTRGIVSATSRMSVDASACPGTIVDAHTEDPSHVKAAIFYSITSTQKGLQGIELGNYLIKRVVRELKAEFPRVSKFSSLSPIPTFRLWLLERLKTAEKGRREVLTSEEVEQLKSYLQTDMLWSELKKLFKTNGWAADTKLVSLLEAPLMRLCAEYLYLEKRRGYALDNVANFHLRNGAVMWRLNWQADPSARGLGNSFGIMVNYRYFLEDAETNSCAYLEKQYIAASDEVRQLAVGARDLTEKFTSKM
ncbi:malonyl-CoA decarboxylase, mitochondrial-like isoform X2 [Zootermopsis nevadensis]|uniref:malonyl-CoA decarboxylase, mitochondrial-like isoform X2 n=1 Tax=Zootermopsis nevadensis TaxID=136037 RepID=UPI000B8E29EA|nr:malonyl-CoA decarboxylase, mitochondrial-like isoform X2 [Zootermopsis nevadensis]